MNGFGSCKSKDHGVGSGMDSLAVVSQCRNSMEAKRWVEFHKSYIIPFLGPPTSGFCLSQDLPHFKIVTLGTELSIYKPMECTLKP